MIGEQTEKDVEESSSGIIWGTTVKFAGRHWWKIIRSVKISSVLA
jgi:hypothetical protein